MAILSNAKTRVFIGGEFEGSYASDAAAVAAYEALTWTEIGNVSDLGEFGDEAQEITYEVLGEARVLKHKGVRDAGEVPLTCAFDRADAGQTMLRQAANSSKRYAVKVELDDAPTGGTPTRYYFAVLVRSARIGLGGANDIVELNAASSITSAILEVPAEA